jgi:C4-dicarboxylate-specific signal transduction histidine kinase
MASKRHAEVLQRVIQSLCGTIAIGIATLACFRFHLGIPTVECLDLIIIVLVSLQGRFWPSFIVSIVALGTLDYYFTPPIFSFQVGDPVNWVGFVAFATTSATITELVSRNRRLMEVKLQESETFLSDAQRLSHTGSFAWRVSTGQTEWSRETFRIFQYERTVAPEMNLIIERTHPDDMDLVKYMFQQSARRGENFEIKYRLLMPDRTTKYLHVVAQARRGQWGGNEFIGAVMDITASKHAEDALTEVQERLARVTRVTTMAELAASIAHEVNQPLAAMMINGYAGIRWLSLEPPNTRELRKALERIVRDGNRAGEVISRIRVLLKRAETAKNPIDLNETIHEVIVLSQSEMEKRKIVLQLHLDPDLPRIIGDRMQLQQVMLHLIRNSIEAMDAVDDRVRTLTISTRLDTATSVLVTVRDCGSGLHPSDVEHVFDTFHSMKPGGLGMGLSVSRSIVENHGGRMWAAVNDDNGATFRFTIATQA